MFDDRGDAVLLRERVEVERVPRRTRLLSQVGDGDVERGTLLEVEGHRRAHEACSENGDLHGVVVTKDAAVGRGQAPRRAREPQSEEAGKHLPAGPYDSPMSPFARCVSTVSAVTLAVLAALACTRPKEDPLGPATTTSAAVRALASCDTVGERGTCFDYASATGSFGVERSLCRSAGGDFRLSTCPTEGTVGSCVVAEGEVKRYYRSTVERGFTAESAKADCDANANGGPGGRFLATLR